MDQQESEGLDMDRCMEANGLEVMWVDVSIVPIPLFGVAIPASSQGIRFRTESSRSKPVNEVELA